MIISRIPLIGLVSSADKLSALPLNVAKLLTVMAISNRLTNKLFKITLKIFLA